MLDSLRAVIRSDIQALAPYVVPVSDGMVKLDAMENPYPLPTALQQSLAQVLSALPLHRYPSPQAVELKRRLARLMGLVEDTPMVLGNGSDELIQMLIQAVAAPGTVVLGVLPSFVMFRMIAEVARVKFVGVPLKEDFSLDLVALRTAIAQHRPALTFVAYPNNPTGNCFDATAITEIIEQARPGLVVVDEAYYPFTPHSFKDRLPSHDNLLLMRTLSKLGLAGVRLGWLCGPSALLEQIDKVRLPYNVSVLDQVAATWLLDHSEELERQVAVLVLERAVLAEGLARLPGVTVFPSQANFLLFRVRGASGIFDGLRRHGILIKNLSEAHPLLQDCLRVTVGTSQENRQFLDALESLIPAP